MQFLMKWLDSLTSIQPMIPLNHDEVIYELDSKP